MSQELRLALIAALSALLGTVVGGMIGYYTNRDLQDIQFKREESQRLRQARSVASLERYRFQTAEGALAPMLVRGGTRPPIPTELEAQVNGSDQQLVLSYLDQKGIAAYANGRLCVSLLVRELPAGVSTTPIRKDELPLYRNWAHCIKAADDAMATVVARRVP